MKIGIILGSIRKGRLGERVALWAQKRLAAHQGIEAVMLDLKEYPLPFYDQAEQPSKMEGPYESDVANKWAAKVSEMEGFIIVTPEYNHGYPAVLKNALDYLYAPWNNKPVSFVSYSTGPIGGARVVEQLRQIAPTLKLTVLIEAMHLGQAQETLNAEGDLQSGPYNEIFDKQIKSMLEWHELLQNKRNA
ncbi:MAG: hypothetical protein NVSMB66_3860 [Candidatus Doudnabacteria bacterium]